MKNILFGVTAAAALLAGLVAPASAATVTSGFDPSAVLKAAVSYRHFATNPATAERIRIGNGDLSGFTGAQLTGGWLGSSADNKIAFSYDMSQTQTTVHNGMLRGPFSFASGNLGPLNYLQILVDTSSGMRTVKLQNVAVNGNPIGTFEAPSLQQWNVKGIDLSTGFNITGEILLTGSHGGGTSTHVVLTVGYVAPSDSVGPVTSDLNVTPMPVLLNGPATVTANVSDAGRGDSTIASAEYSLNGGTGMPADALDGAFDEIVEDVTATILQASQIGANEVCVHGTDAAGNVGEPTCQSFRVDYDFHGFLSPIDMGVGVVNKAKAGQAVPAKWRLTDANGLPIADPASFVGLFSYAVNCADWAGDPLTAVQEVAAGQSALQYNGDGYWQYNWKTPKEYADTCRLMYVEFNSGGASPVVQFSFAKK